jgi:hypothetical protein
MAAATSGFDSIGGVGACFASVPDCDAAALGVGAASEAFG